MENETQKIKCYVCNKNINFIDQIYCKCRCEKNFCQYHKYPESKDSDHSHKCEYDYVAEGKKNLQIRIPKIVSDKITNRV